MNIRFICQSCGGQANYDMNTGQVVCSNCGSTDFAYEIEDKCPSCGGVLTYDNEKDVIYCTNCNQVIKEEDTYEVESTPNEDLGTYDSSECECPGCGAQVYIESNTAATKCPFCGGNIQVSKNLTGVAKPWKILPFKYDRASAEQKFQKWCKKGFLCPSDFRIGDRIKCIQPLYIPFWIYDIEGLGRITYNATKVKRYSKGSYDYTETSHYKVKRDVDVFVEKLPCDASKKMDDALMDLLEPFDLNELKDFNMGYLAGNLTEKYDYTDEELLNRAYKRATEYLINFADASVTGYSTKTIVNKNIKMKKDSAHYILLPIWTVFYTHGDKEYVFAMNGQTGKVVGKPPISFKKVAGIFLGGTTIATLLQYLLFGIILL